MQWQPGASIAMMNRAVFVQPMSEQVQRSGGLQRGNFSGDIVVQNLPDRGAAELPLHSCQTLLPNFGQVLFFNSRAVRHSNEGPKNSFGPPRDVLAADLPIPQHGSQIPGCGVGEFEFFVFELMDKTDSSEQHPCNRTEVAAATWQS